ncbi:MAG: hypothetical protein ABL883_13235 [Terricaulis sp.]
MARDDFIGRARSGQADEPLVWYEGAGTSDRRYLVADERGSVIAVTNSAGAALQINAYDEYGAPAPAISAASAIPAKPGCRKRTCTTTKPAPTRQAWAASCKPTRSGSVAG